MKTKSYKVLRLLNIIGFIAMVTVNALANIIPINGIKTGEVADLYPNLFVPAGITFAIWGLIYFLLFLFIIYQGIGLFSNKIENSNYIGEISYFFLISCILNISWLFAWHYKLIMLSTIIMILLLLSLITIYLRLGIGVKKVETKVKYLVHLPFSIYLAWITIATVANITTLLVSINWNGFGLSPVFWTILVIIVATLITLLILWYKNDIYYAFTVLWAFLGIIIKRNQVGGDYSIYIIINVVICMAIILILLIPRIKKYA